MESQVICLDCSNEKTCYHCGVVGHVKTYCPQLQRGSIDDSKNGGGQSGKTGEKKEQRTYS